MLGIDLKDRVAVVTGSSRGIGLGVAKMLAKAGCHVAGCSQQDSRSEKVDNFKKTIESYGQKAFYHKCDITNPEEIALFIQAVFTHFGKIDILISNAGTNVFLGVDDCSLEDWTYNINLNLRSHWLVAKACKPYLEQSVFGGSVVIMSSNHAYSTIKGCFPYNTTKTALLGLVNALAVEWKNKVRVNGLAPGFIDTDGGDSWFNTFDDPEKEKENTIERHLVSELGTSDQVGAFCAFLSSGYASFITGTTYLMDGGRSAILQDDQVIHENTKYIPAHV